MFSFSALTLTSHHRISYKSPPTPSKVYARIFYHSISTNSIAHWAYFRALFCLVGLADVSETWNLITLSHIYLVLLIYRSAGLLSNDEGLLRLNSGPIFSYSITPHLTTAQTYDHLSAFYVVPKPRPKRAWVENFH